MNLVKEAIDLGFSNAAVMDTKKLVFVPEYRNFCEENRCGCYNLNPACPPSCGTAEEMKQRAFRYKNTLVLQTTLEDSKDPAQYKKDKLRHNIMTEKLAGKMEAEGICPPMYYLADGCQWRYEYSNRCLRDPAERFRDSDAAYYGCLCPGGSTFSV